MATMYNVSADLNDISHGDWNWYNNQADANAAAVAAASNTSQTHYVHNVSWVPVFKAEITTNIVTEVM